VETKTGKVRVVETERRREKGRSWKETRRKREKAKGRKEKPKEGKKNRSKKSSRRIGDLGMRRKKQQSWRKRLKSWSQQNSISKFMSSAKRQGKIYPLLREEWKEVYEFITEQLKKEYIRFLKLPQTAPVFFVGKKDEKKQMVQDYRYLNE